MDLERIATASVTASISVTDVLSSYINEGDKEPSWDGNIYIYSNKDKRKEGIKKIPVQVKGKKKDDFSKEIIKYPVSVVDLENYLYDGGVVFFVVYISNNGLKTKIYYSCLLPIKIRSILDNNIKSKKSINIELNTFPEDNMRKVSVLLNFYDHMQKQTSFAKSKLQSLDDLKKQGILEGVTFFVSNYGNSNLNQYQLLFQDDIYMYANIKGSTVPQPLMDIPMDLHIAETIEMKISVNGRVYYSQYQIVRSKEKVVLTIGKSVRISMFEERKGLIIKFTPTPILKYAIIDLEFILALKKYSQFEMDDQVISLDPDRMFSLEQTEQLQRNLEYYNKLVKVLKIFKLETDINLNNLTPGDNYNNHLFITGLLENKPVSGLREGLPFVVRVNYLKSKVVIGLKKENAPNTYRISDYFAEPIILYYKDQSGTYRTSKYDFLEVDDFLEIRNIDYEDILESYKKLSNEEHIYENANNMLLKLLLAYDKSGDTRNDILDIAYDFAVWLYSTDIDENELTYAIRILNLYQVLKRRGNLKKNQKMELLCLADDLKQIIQVRIGAYLLLDNQISAETLFAMLDDDWKIEFKKFPIFRFWKEITDG